MSNSNIALVGAFAAFATVVVWPLVVLVIAAHSQKAPLSRLATRAWSIMAGTLFGMALGFFAFLEGSTIAAGVAPWMLALIPLGAFAGAGIMWRILRQAADHHANAHAHSFDSDGAQRRVA